MADDDEESGSRKRTIRFGDEKETAPETAAADTEESVMASGPSSLQKKMLAMAGQVINN